MYAGSLLNSISRQRILLVTTHIRPYPKLRKTDQLLISHRGNSSAKDISPNKHPQRPPNIYRGGSLSIGLMTATCMGALWFNNWSLSLEESELSRVLYWDPIVKSRIETTYGYLGSSVLTSALVSTLLLTSSTVIGIIARHPILTATVSYCLAVGSFECVKRTSDNSPARAIAWITNCSSLSPLMIATWKLIGPPVLRAYLYALCILGSLAITAMTAPSKSIFESTAPLSAALGVVCCGSIGGRYFLPPSTYLLLNIKGVAIATGLMLFCLALLRDKTMDMTEEHGFILRPHDPLKAGVQIYMNKLDIFHLIAKVNRQLNARSN